MIFFGLCRRLFCHQTKNFKTFFNCNSSDTVSDSTAAKKCFSLYQLSRATKCQQFKRYFSYLLLPIIIFCLNNFSLRLFAFSRFVSITRGTIKKENTFRSLPQATSIRNDSAVVSLPIFHSLYSKDCHNFFI